MTRKKMLPLALLAAVVVLLAVLLAALHSAAEEEELPGIALCPFTAAELNTVSYSGENVESHAAKRLRWDLAAGVGPVAAAGPGRRRRAGGAIRRPAGQPPSAGAMNWPRSRPAAKRR